MSKRAITRVIVVCLAAVVLIALAGCSTGTSGNSSNVPGAGGGGGGAAGGGTSGGGAGANTIVMKDFSFQPANLEVKAGTKVTWENQDSAQHTVTSDDGVFTSPALDPGKDFSFTFSTAGTFKYHCSIHPSMVGQVVVK